MREAELINLLLTLSVRESALVWHQLLNIDALALICTRSCRWVGDERVLVEITLRILDDHCILVIHGAATATIRVQLSPSHAKLRRLVVKGVLEACRQVLFIRLCDLFEHLIHVILRLHLTLCVQIAAKGLSYGLFQRVRCFSGLCGSLARHVSLELRL